jgi:hypothetical protein
MWKTKVISLSLTPAEISFLKKLKSELKISHIKSVITVSDIVSVMVRHIAEDETVREIVIAKCIEEALQNDIKRKRR